MSPEFRKTTLTVAIVAACLALLPTIFAWSIAPPGNRYLMAPYNADDHMVYAAWISQALDGRFLFQNLFTVESQPGLTVHLYFWALGQLAHLTGILGAMTLARIGFSVLFVFLIARLIARLEIGLAAQRWALVLTCFGGGIGFVTWQAFGVTKATPGGWVTSLLKGGLPTDVWQPEGFVFPSMLTNGLFMVSLCLMVGAFLALLDARESWRPVLGGAIAIGLLMNIHSYDVLIVALVMVGFLVSCLVMRQATGIWALRCGVIAAGALPAALWFLYVIASDPVFQSRAATETYSPGFRQVIVGYLPAIVAGSLALVLRAEERRRTWLVPALIGLVAGLWAIAQGPIQGYWLTPVEWAVAMAIALAVCALAARPEPFWNLLVAWATVGLIAPFFPALFQRKLAMGLAVPWMILAAWALAEVLLKMNLRERMLAGALAALTFVGSSFAWLAREMRVYIVGNVSNTTVHPTFLPADDLALLDRLRAARQGRTVVLAMPGVPTPRAADFFGPPAIPDLNPFASGLAGVTTYAGHWSETPRYPDRRREVTDFFLAETDPAVREALLQTAGAGYLIAPRPDAFAPLPLADLRPVGEVIAESRRFWLIRVR